MKKEDFYRKYANTPLDKRFVPLNFTEGGLTTLHEVWKEVDALEELIRPLVIRQQELIKFAEPILLPPPQERGGRMKAQDKQERKIKKVSYGFSSAPYMDVELDPTQQPQPFVHGEDGTHYCCQEVLDKLGGKATCCGCSGHKCQEPQLLEAK